MTRTDRKWLKRGLCNYVSSAAHRAGLEQHPPMPIAVTARLRHGAAGTKTCGPAEAARARASTVHWNAPTRPHDVQKQIALLEKVVALHYRGIVLALDETLRCARLSRTRWLPISHRGRWNGTRYRPGQQLIVRLNDEVAGGRLAARRLGLILGGQGAVAVLGLDPKLRSMSLRDRSFEDTLASRVSPHPRCRATPGTGQRRPGTRNNGGAFQAGMPLDALVALSAEATQGGILRFDRVQSHRHHAPDRFDQDLLPPIRNGGRILWLRKILDEIGRLAMQQIEGKLLGSQFQTC